MARNRGTQRRVDRQLFPLTAALPGSAEKAAKQKDPAGEYASASLPTLHKHLDTAQKIEQGKSASR